MKRHLDQTKPTAQPSPTCWQRETPSPCLRLEPNGGEAHLFPYQQLLTASLTHAEGTDSIRLTFASHEVELLGRNLRELLHGMQEFAVKWVRPVPERYQATAGGETGLVTSVRVKPID